MNRALQLFLGICLLLTSWTAKSQTACDSLIINYYAWNNDTLVFEVYNNNQNTLFDYPGFMLVDSLGDTIAIETVNYFGIGQGPQLHYLIVTDTLEFNINYTLQLYTGFYDSLACTYPFMLATIATTYLPNYPFKIYPNPLNLSRGARLTIDFGVSYPTNSNLVLYNSLGQLLKESPIETSIQQIEVVDLPKGIYLLSIRDKMGRLLETRKLVLD